MSEPLLSRFTPSLMSAEALEAIFVQREDLAQRLVDLIHESAQEGSGQQNTLVVGPRGIGKTHLVALIYHRLKNQEDLKKKLLIAWLREEEWGISSFLDLLLRILASLRAEYGDSGLEDVETLFDLSQENAERKAGDRLVSYVGKRSLLVIAENLDEIFSGLGASGQRRLRAFLQEHGFVSLLATSQSLFNGVALQTSPFYGFFRVQHLAELDHRDAVQLLTRIAELTGKSDLAAALKTPEGRARVRAVHHLAGGNPRIYIIFSQFLTRDSLDELVGPMIALLDDLTPYYQARMAWLSPQQRKIVEFLCDQRGAVTVKEIARQCFASQQSVSGQLKALRDAGYVLSLPKGRESYYEIREPLMRLCMEMKKHRGEPVRLLVDFLRLWYSPRELRAKLSEDSFRLGPIQEALSQAVTLSESANLDPRISACIADYERAIDLFDFERIGEISDEMLAVVGFTPDEKVARSEVEARIIRAALIGQSIRRKTESIEVALGIPGMLRQLGSRSINDVEIFFHRDDDEIRFKRIPDGFASWGLNLEFRKKRSEWNRSAITWVQASRESDFLTFLGVALVRSVLFFRDGENFNAIEPWLAAWQEAGSGIAELEVPLRLLKGALRFLETNDMRVLLELSSEERRVVEALLVESAEESFDNGAA